MQINRRELELIAAMLRVCRWAEGRCPHTSLRHWLHQGCVCRAIWLHCFRARLITCHVWQPAILSASPAQGEPHVLPPDPLSAVPQPPQLWTAAKQRFCLSACSDIWVLWAEPCVCCRAQGLDQKSWMGLKLWAHLQSRSPEPSLPQLWAGWVRLAETETVQPVPRQGQELGMASHWQQVAEMVWRGQTESTGNSGAFWEGCWWGQGAAGCLFFRSKCVLCNHFRPPSWLQCPPHNSELIICANVLISGEQYCCYI